MTEHIPVTITDDRSKRILLENLIKKSDRAEVTDYIVTKINVLKTYDRNGELVYILPLGREAAQYAMKMIKQKEKNDE